MKTYQAALLASAARLASAQYPSGEQYLRLYPNSDCTGPSVPSGEFAASSVLLPSVNDACISGFGSISGFQSSGTSHYKAYLYASDIPSGCSLAVTQHVNIQPSACGTATDVINPGTEGCKEIMPAKQGGYAMCCGGQGEGCQVIPQLTKRAPLKAKSVEAGDVVRDVTEVKRAPILQRLRKRSCSFTASGSPFTSRGSQQITSDQESCPSNSSADCSISNSVGVTHSSTNTFGASESTSIGTDELFADIQESVSFSYSYSYTSSSTQSQSYTVNVPAGESGYITFTPTVSCVSGSFSSSCNLPQQSGTACIPLYVTGQSGALQGDFSFLEEQ